MHYLKFRRVYVLCYMVENIISYLNFVKQLTVLKTILGSILCFSDFYYSATYKLDKLIGIPIL